MAKKAEGANVGTWRENFEFKTLFVPKEFLDRFNERLNRNGVRTKAVLIRNLLEGWLNGRFKVSVDKEEDKKVNGSVVFSLYYPKEFVEPIKSKLSKDGIQFETILLRALLREWMDGKLNVKFDKHVQKQYRAINVQIPMKLNKKFEAKVEKDGESKAGAIQKLTRLWVEKKAGAGDEGVAEGDELFSFGILMPLDIFEEMEARLSKDKMDGRAGLFRGLIRQYVEGKIDCKDAE